MKIKIIHRKKMFEGKFFVTFVVVRTSIKKGCSLFALLKGLND